mmetsp:Transcript_6345/g.8429  ORF Transcript_6345/g.8429 Transcript_6345/m.8429 type:complete len:238 (-) Transcript_6345:1145-1858(-)
MTSYLQAYFGEKLSEEDCAKAISKWKEEQEFKTKGQSESNVLETIWSSFQEFAMKFTQDQSLESIEESNNASEEKISEHDVIFAEATNIVSLLGQTTEELDSIMNLLGGGYIKPKPGGDLLRDGTSVLPTGRNIHALDPYRMPSAGAWARGQRAAEEILRQHCEANNGAYPETTAVTLWGLDTIKTRGESIAIVLSLVGARPVKEGTGRTVRYDLVPLEELGRPRVDVLASLSGIFR